MSGYRDDQEAQRMRVASLEERLAELEAENEELRVRDAEVPLPNLPRRAPVASAGPVSQDVADTLASLKAMVGDIALSDAEKAREEERSKPVVQSRAPANPELTRLAERLKAKFVSAPRQAPAEVDETPLVSLAKLKGEFPTNSSEFNEMTSLQRDWYWRGMRNGIAVGVAISVIAVIAFLYLIVLSR